MLRVTEDQFREFKRYVFNYVVNLNTEVSTIADTVVYRENKKVIDRHYFAYDGLWEVDEDIYHKLFETEFMNNVRSSMNFCKNCCQLVFKEDDYCSNKCRSKYEELNNEVE